jgi:hypothetical protein
VNVTRRRLFKRAGLGIGALGVLSVAPGAIVTRQRGTGPIVARKRAPTNTIPSVAYVRNAEKGEVVLMVGTKKIVRTDHTLVEYLGRCCDTQST